MLFEQTPVSEFEKQKFCFLNIVRNKKPDYKKQSNLNLCF